VFVPSELAATVWLLAAAVDWRIQGQRGLYYYILVNEDQQEAKLQNRTGENVAAGIGIRHITTPSLAIPDAVI